MKRENKIEGQMCPLGKTCFVAFCYTEITRKSIQVCLGLKHVDSTKFEITTFKN